ncbi:MAG: bifunctional homocysteine S-methyltransferase/methylenetetrahydrofolate reductase [Armatimonadetes bacterium]|nr:bifunctional homocysteine S-methyltransferase/methylenetetrahydrofolate reductase [Armatimonadota bacterium]
MQPFRTALTEDRVWVFDGAMGTMLYQKGVYINRSYEETNLRQPELVLGIHQAYVRAGAEILETNTFGANGPKLAKYGLEDQLEAVNRRAVELAREAAGERAYVAGAIGPLGVRLEPYGPTTRNEARALFRQQATALAGAGVALFVLETFGDLEEIHQALLAVREVSDLPVIAQMTIRADGRTDYGTPSDLFTRRLDEWGAEVIGLNCSEGPAGILNVIEKMHAATVRPLSAQPNAGLPRQVEGRTMYMASPDYMARFARRLIQSGVRFVGGCCGTTPEHIKEIFNTVRALSPRGRLAPVSVAEIKPPEVQPVPVPERSQLAARLCRGEFATSVEIAPPKGCDPEEMLHGVVLLKEAGVNAVNVPDGPRASSRMGVIATSVLIQERIGIEAIPHYCCRDRNLLGMFSDLLGAAALGIRNLLIITGDPPRMGPLPEATAVFDIDSIGLTALVNRLNHGVDLGGNPIGKPTAYFIGVGCNPTAIDLDYEVRRFREKVEAGAQFAITQPVFDPDQLLRFLERIADISPRIPLMAGIWPLVSYRNAEFLAHEVPGVVVPETILERMREASQGGREAGLAEGIRIARETFARVRDVVQGIQVSAPFGRIPTALKVFEGLV